MESLLCFVAIDFVDDPNVAGYPFWYFCPFGGAKAGDMALAPLGRHNNPQKGVIRKVIFTEEINAPYPFDKIKKVIELIMK